LELDDYDYDYSNFKKSIMITIMITNRAIDYFNRLVFDHDYTTLIYIYII